MFVLFERGDVVWANARVAKCVVVEDVVKVVFCCVTVLLHCPVEENVGFQLGLLSAFVVQAALPEHVQGGVPYRAVATVRAEVVVDEASCVRSVSSADGARDD